jgi:NAD(P)-dependent dehydrogenase (short-subunit alcohol dehydrogenase family)
MNFVITGAGKGIGFELTQFALEAGHSVVALVRDPDSARGLQSAKKDHGSKLEILKCDVSDSGAVGAAADQLLVKFENQGLDVLINNAGILTDNDDHLSMLTPQGLDSVLRTNSMAPVLVTQGLIKALLKAKSPKVVNITSQLGSIADNSSGGYYVYRMSKAALNMFTKTLSIEYPQITALALHPGWVRTQMGGPQAPTLPRESARGLFKIIIEATSGQSGQFIDFRGQSLPW